MAVVVEQGSSFHIGVKLRLALSVHRLVEVTLVCIEPIFSQHHRSAGQKDKHCSDDPHYAYLSVLS